MTDKIFCANATELLQEASKDNFSGAEVECAICHKRTKKAGLTSSNGTLEPIRKYGGKISSFL